MTTDTYSMRVLVLHPWPIVPAALSSTDLNITTACDLADAIRLAGRQKLNVALVDPITYPDAIATLSTLLPVVALTTDTTDEGLRRALVDGATGYLHVGESVDAIVHCLQSVSGGDIQLDTARFRTIAIHMAQVAQHHLRHPVGLSGRELQVLAAMATGVTNAEIAAKLTIAIGSVSNITHSIFSKTGTRNRVEATLWALRNGLVAL